jgi:LmbE family N-acetylglucosaminyl deacetylase
MIMSDNLTIIAVFAHPDDELGVVGTLANHVENGDTVYVVLLTKGENASTLCCSRDEIVATRLGHAKQIEKLLGVTYRFLDIPDSAVTPSVANAKKLAAVFKELQPDIVITWDKSPQMGHGHPDHRYTHDITLDALSYMRYQNPDDDHEPYRQSVSFYTLAHSLGPDNPGVTFIDVSSQLEKIKQFIKVYQQAYGSWEVWEFKESIMKSFSRLAGTKYAEAFKKITWRKPRKLLD